MTYRLLHGDCVEQMRTLPDASIDAIVTDPPYHLSFMSKAWDHAPSGAESQAMHLLWATEALRVLKPGGHLLAFGGTRTYHRLACAIEDAGFEIRDCLAWLYGSGFPKSLDVSKAIDKAAGAEREVVGQRTDGRYAHGFSDDAKRALGGVVAEDNESGFSGEMGQITAPATPEAAEWQGWGTALKPAHEPIVLARKPLTGTVAANVLANGTGALNVDGCRIEGPKGDGNWKGRTDRKRGDDFNGYEGGWNDDEPGEQNAAGRWPANVILDDDAAAQLDEQAPDTGGGGFCGGGIGAGLVYGDPGSGQTRMTGRVDANGGASRFFYVPKASRAERNAGLDGFEEQPGPSEGEPNIVLPVKNPHPTVKPIELMRWLCRLITPPGGTILDPFTGSGTTGAAAMLDGFDFIGCELDAEYVKIAEARIAFWAQYPGATTEAVLASDDQDLRDRGQMDLLGEL